MNYKQYSIHEVIAVIEQVAPTSYQESYDNAGLIVGDYNKQISKALISIDVTEVIVDEAIQQGAELIIAHHPIVFRGLKRFNGSNYVERTVIKAIKNDIAIYAVHTNLDNVINGVNRIIADKLQLVNREVLVPLTNDLTKLVTFIPKAYSESVQKAIFDAGAGHIGKYEGCGYVTEGVGSFMATEGAKPYVGEIDEVHHEEEVRFETIFPNHLKGKVVNALTQTHPYEEVAYDLYTVKNVNRNAGAGLVGELSEPIDELAFLQQVKSIFGAGCVKYTEPLGKPLKRIALCGGSGSFLLKNAIQSGADLFLSADFKYHEFFDSENKIVIADIGHYESEQFTKDVILEILTEKIPNFATCLSKKTTNPVKYL